MSRKSRKNLIGIRTPRDDFYFAAGYLRLSVTKEDESSESIENQKKVIEHYIANQPDIMIKKYYVDAPASGTDFERKAFQEMLDDINSGKISCVVVKDAYVKLRINFLQKFFWTGEKHSLCLESLCFSLIQT